MKREELCYDSVDEKLISRSEKEMENFIQAKLRIITREQPLRKLQELFRPLQVKTQLYKFFETEGCTSNDVLFTVYTIQIFKYKVVCHHGSLQDQEGRFSFKELSCW